MRTPAQIGGHPVHPMLVTIPIGLWIFSLVADFIAMRSGAPDTWHAAALYTMVGGILGALAAAVPGLIDLMSLKEPALKSTAIKHMGLNLTIVALYVVNAWTRMNASVSPNVSLILSVIAIALLLVSGWLGGKMVYEAGVAVHTEELTSPGGTWTGERAGSRSWSPAAGGTRGDHAMASDADRPSRGSGESRPG
jgi:uncharacterized membrane protein